MDDMMKDLQQESAYRTNQDGLDTSMHSGASLEFLEQHQAKEHARLLHRFKELREWQQQQQQQLMMQQHLQLSTLQQEQNKVQSMLASGQQSGFRGAARSTSPIMTPPCKPRPGGINHAHRGGNKDQQIAHSMAAGISMDSGLVSMQDTLKSQSSLPKPVMYLDPSQSNNLPEEDKYTNSELFSNPGAEDNNDSFELVADNGRRNVNNNNNNSNSKWGQSPPAPDWMSDTSEHYVAPRLPPPRPTKSSLLTRLGVKQGPDHRTTQADQLAGLEQLLSTAPAGLLQKMLTLLPKSTDSISSDGNPMNRMVENSASPTLNGPKSTDLPGKLQRHEGWNRDSSYPSGQTQGVNTTDMLYCADDEHNVQDTLLGPNGHYLHQDQWSERAGENQSRGHDVIQPLLKGTMYPQAIMDHNLQLVPRSVLALARNGADLQRGETETTNRRDELNTDVQCEYNEEDGQEEEEEDEEENYDEMSQNTTAQEVMPADDFEERPIQGTGGAKSFERLLEEQLREEEEKERREQEENENSPKSRPRPFLRKGQGIARFNSAPKKPPPKRSSSQAKRSSSSSCGFPSREETDVRKLGPAHEHHGKTGSTSQAGKTKNSVAARLKSQATRKVSNKDAKYNAKESRSEDPGESGSPLSAPAKLTLIRNAASRKMDEWRNKDKDGTHPVKASESMIPRANNANDASHPQLGSNPDQSPSLKSVEDPDAMELDSLAEFELLEDVADNMSFCSNSSLVRKLVCSDAQDHQEAVKKLQTITEMRRLQQSERHPPPPFSSTSSTMVKSSNRVSNTERKYLDSNSDKEQLLNADLNRNINCSEPNIHNKDLVVSNCGKPNKMDNIIVAKPVHDSSSDVTLTDSSDEDDNIEDSGKMQFGTNFSSGYFTQPNGFTNNISTNHPPSSSLSSVSHAQDFPPSPQKPIPRKVASITTKVNAANDTLSMLQALSRKAGFLSTSTTDSQVSQSSDGSNLNGLEGISDRYPGFHESMAASSFCGGPTKANGVNEYDAFLQNHRLTSSLLNGNWNEGNRAHAFSNGIDEKEDELNKGSSGKSDHFGCGEEEENEEEEEDVEERFFTADAFAEIGRDRHQLSTVEEEKELSVANGYDDEAEWVDDDNDDNNPLAKRAAELNRVVSVSKASHGKDNNDSPSTPPTSKLVSKLFPKLKAADAKPIPQSSSQSGQPNELSGQGQDGQGSESQGIANRLLRDKLKELETEIERFRSENSNLDRLRKEREEGVFKLKLQIESFEKEKEAELKRLEEFKVEEMKKLKRERKLFDTYQKKVRSMPDKRDREEIENLNAQLEETQDELRRKESRWTATVSRLKNRLAEVELENGELKEEVRILEKKRLEWLASQSQGKMAKDSKQLVQGEPVLPSSHPRSSTPTHISEEVHPNPSMPVVSAPGKKSATVKNAPVTLRTAVPAVTSSSASCRPSRPTSQGPPSKSTGLSRGLPSSSVTAANQHPVSKEPIRLSGSLSPQSSSTIRSSGESLPTQKESVPVMMETMPFARPPAQDQLIPASTAVGTLSSASMFNPSSRMAEGSKSAATLATEKAVIDKGNPMDFVDNVHSDGKCEKVYKNGAKEVRFPNGTIKEISSDGQTIICRLANGDIRQIFPDHRVVYIFSEAQIMQTTFPDGLETFQFKNGQIERRYPDETVEITFPSKDVKFIFPDGAQEVRLTDGTIMTYSSQGERTVEYPSGDREVHTAEYQRREFPDGIVKTIYSDGRHETRFPNGRVRMRDKAGNVIMDQICYR